MGLNYNPSSFATNKTILEAIEELKKYLQTTPLACIYSLPHFYFNVNTLTYNKTVIDNPNDQELKLGDIIIGDDYFGFIESMDETTITIDQWRAIGVKIQSITTLENIIEFENIPAGANTILISYPADPPYDYQRCCQIQIEIKYYDGFHLDIHGNPELQTITDYVNFGNVNAIWSTEDPITHDITISVDVISADFTTSINTFTIPAGATGQAGADGNDGVSVTGATIDGSNHLILTLSDGNTIDAGALPTPSEYTHTVSITTTSGTFSDDDFAKLGYGDSVIKYTDAYSVTTVYKLKIETASILEFEAIDAASRNNLKLIDVNKSTKAYSMTSIAMITSATISSGTATSGKVLTANGSGGCSWETAGGGGGSLYKHNLNFSSSSSPKYMTIQMTLYTTSSTAITNFTALMDYFNNNLHYNQCTGKYVDTANNINSLIVRAGATTVNTFRVQCIALDSTGTSLSSEQLPSTSMTIYDTVIQIM